MVDRYKNVLEFYLLATKLKYKLRTGWDENHWNITSERIESIAEHIYGTCILAISIESELKINVNLNKVIKMLVIHELGEVLIGDITPFDDITVEEKAEIEHKAVENILRDLIKKDELYQLMLEFDAHETKESLFAYYCDKLEADIQAKVYQDYGYQNGLDNQDNNVVFKSDKIQEFIANGAQNAFDIWYEWDKDKYNDSKEFSKLLKTLKNFNTKA